MGAYFFLIIGSAIVQSTDMIIVLGEKPNLVFISLLTLVFFIEKTPQYILATLVGGITLMMVPGLNWEVGMLMGVVLVAHCVRKKLPWRAQVTISFFAFAGTILIETSQANSIIVGYNVALSLILFFIMQWITGRKIMY